VPGPHRPTQNIFSLLDPAREKPSCHCGGNNDVDVWQREMAIYAAEIVQRLTDFQRAGRPLKKFGWIGVNPRLDKKHKMRSFVSVHFAHHTIQADQRLK